MNCTFFVIENHCTRYDLRLFGAKAFPLLIPFLSLSHARARAGTIFDKVFGMTFLCGVYLIVKTGAKFNIVLPVQQCASLRNNATFNVYVWGDDMYGTDAIINI